MKPTLLLALLLWQAASFSHTGKDPGAPHLDSEMWALSAGQPLSSPTHPNFRYQRTITLPASPTASPSQTCAILDPALFPHAGPSLRDLRLFQEATEIPYVITLSEPQQPDSDPARVFHLAQPRNLGLRHRSIVFDLEMPHRPYTDVVLDLAAQNFLATATVSGTRDPNYTHQTSLGAFTLFDLTAQHLSRTTTLPLQETDLPYLHIELAISPAPGTPTPTPQSLLKMLQGVTVPPSRDAQSLYTTAATATSFTQRNRQTLASFHLPERIPIERVSFDLAPAFKSNFSRDVHIADHPNTASDADRMQPKDALARSNSTDLTPPNPDMASEILSGTISRVHLIQAGRDIREQQLSLPATLGSNMQTPATVKVTVDNGDDPPLPLTAIRLEMRQRKLCFNPPSASPLTLFYGDPALNAPQYDYTRLWTPSATLHTAQLGPEQLNLAYRLPPDNRPLTERHPRLLWLALLAVLCLLAAIALHPTRSTIR